MILPVLFIVGILCLGFQHKTKTQSAQTVISGRGPNRRCSSGGAIRVVERTMPNDKYRSMLSQKIRNRQPVTRWLVDNALLESFNDGDMAMVQALTRAFKRPDATPANASEKHDASEKQTPDEPSRELSELGQPALKSPLDGVSDEDWMEFVARVRTKPPGFKSDKYLGQYEQNRGRLKQLGISEPTDPEQEHDVLAQDMARHYQDSAELINQWSGDVVNVSGTDHPICPSGILGLLKSAGPEGARSWLSNPGDRAQYPKTTEAFLRTNGCF